MPIYFYKILSSTEQNLEVIKGRLRVGRHIGILSIEDIAGHALLLFLETYDLLLNTIRYYKSSHPHDSSLLTDTVYSVDALCYVCWRGK